MVQSRFAPEPRSSGASGDIAIDQRRTDQSKYAAIRHSSLPPCFRVQFMGYYDGLLRETEPFSLLIPVGRERIYSFEGFDIQRLRRTAVKNILNDRGRQKGEGKDPGYLRIKDLFTISNFLH